MSTITFSGNLAAAPELRKTNSGKSVVRMTVIENHRRKNAAGQWEDGVPSAHRVRVWGSTAENLTESISKGARVIVTGRIVTERWQDEADNTHEMQIIEATDVGISLQFHTATPVRTGRNNAIAEADDHAQA